jgi:hypothetical protein
MGISNTIPPSRLIQPGVVANTAARPTSPFTGQAIYQVDTNQYLIWNGTAWVLFGDPTWVPIKTSTFSNQLVANNCERNGPPGVSAFYAFGNGAQGTNISLPFAGKLVAATLTASTDINGTITVRPVLNAALQSATYELSVTAATQISTGNYLSAPLSIPAGQRFGWQCQSQTATVGSTVITFYMRFD